MSLAGIILVANELMSKNNYFSLKPQILKMIFWRWFFLQDLTNTAFIWEKKKKTLTYLEDNKNLQRSSTVTENL